MSDQRKRELSPIIKELISGYVGGVTNILSGQPLDIVKVRFQSLAEKSIFQSMKKIFEKEGILAFWKGSFFPIMTVGFSISILFAMNNNLKIIYRNYKNDQNMKFHEYFILGGIAGLFYGITIAPIEHIKIRLQIQTNSANMYKNSIDCARKITNQYGVRGLFKGLIPTLVREFIGNGTYFATYFYIKDNYDIESKPKTILIGGLSGIFAWNATFFIDNFKSKIQSDDFLKPIYKGRNIFKILSLKDLTTGYIPGLIKSFPTNGVSFLAYELTGKYLK